MSDGCARYVSGSGRGAPPLLPHHAPPRDASVQRHLSPVQSLRGVCTQAAAVHVAQRGAASHDATRRDARGVLCGASTGRRRCRKVTCVDWMGPPPARAAVRARGLIGLLVPPGPKRGPERQTKLSAPNRRRYLRCARGSLASDQRRRPRRTSFCDHGTRSDSYFDHL